MYLSLMVKDKLTCVPCRNAPPPPDTISSGSFAAAISLKILPLVVDSFVDKDIDRLLFDKGDSGEKMGECLV